MSKIQVMAHTSFLGHTGYNNHSKNFFTHLNNYIPTRVRNYSYCKDLSYLKPEEMSLLIEQDWNDPPHKIGSPFVRDPEATLVNIVLNESHHYYFYDPYESPMIAYNVWEATKQIPEYFNRILEFDQFWCPTEWQRQCTIEQGYPEHRVKVIHEGVNGNIFCPTKETNPLLAKKHFYQKYDIPYETFTFMIFGRWDYRKFTTEMVQMFAEEFKDDDDVMLILSADNPFSSDGIETTEERLKHYKIPTDKIKIVHFPPREDYIKFLQHGNCLLSCSRSEGWNLPLMEALACGTPAIASNWGGHLEFADGIAHLVDVPKELPPKQIYFMDESKDYGLWGEPDKDHLKKVMRDVFSDYHQAKQDALKRSKYIRQLYTWDNAARTAERHIKELAKKHVYIPEKADNNLFKTQFEVTDDGYPKVTIIPKRLFSKILVRLKRLNGSILFESWFNNVEAGVGYWVTTNTLEIRLDGIVLEIFSEDKMIHSETKKYVNDNPKISFVTSFYNAESFIDDLYQSIINQTFTDWEWVITDDGSQDNTPSIVKNLSTSDRRIRYVDQKHKQEIYWNPHKYANGEIICTIDADDAIVPKTALVISKFFDKNPKVKCIHTSGNYYEETFDGHEKFKNPSYCRMDNHDSILNKHVTYLKNKSGYERLGQMFGVIRAYRNPGPDFNFNDGNYQLGKHEDLVKLLRLEELGTPFYLNRTLYKVRMRADGSNSGSWKNPEKETEYEKMREVANKRRKKAYKHLDTYDSIREELYAFLYSNLNEEKDKKRISCIGFELDEKDQKLIKDIYFDHDVSFEDIDVDVDYVFAICRTINDVEIYQNLTNNLRNSEVLFFFINNDWTPEYYNRENGDGYFTLFEKSKDLLVKNRSFKWSTYLYKYCTIIYNVIRPPKRLNLGCGNDIKEGYINVDKYNNTGEVDYKWDLAKLEVEDEELDEIYTSHVFEHIGINDIYAVVEEWRRALKPNGDLIIRMPNLEHEVKIWLDASDEKKWMEVARIFGSQSFEGNTHYNGFNPGSLKSFIERFDFEVVEIREQNPAYGNEIYLHAKKKKDVKRLKAHYICHFVDGPFLEIRAPKTNNFFIVDFLDPDNNSLVHQQTMSVNTWTRPHRRYFTNWLVQVRRNGILDYEHKFDLQNKNVLIGFDSKSLGDTLAWLPVANEFRKRHSCNLFLSTFWNKLFDTHSEYKGITFVPPGDKVNDIYASYMVGCFDGDKSKNKKDWRKVNLQQVAGDILNIDCEEELPVSIVTQKNRKRVTPEPYVAISEFSTFQCKFWGYVGGWQEVVDYLNAIGYKVVVISKEKTKLENVIDRTNRTMTETINTINECEFFMGVSSGPAWLAWALKKPTVLISGCTEKWLEFKTNVKRIINKDVCHGCFNSTEYKFDRGNWNYCPRLENTPRQFECTKKIKPQFVIDSINEIVEASGKEIKINETKNLFYIPPKNEIKNLEFECKDFEWSKFAQFGPVRTMYHEIFIQEDYKHSGCQVEKDDIVVDIGANVGVFTRYAYIKGAKKILSFEAEKDNFEYLLRNKPDNCDAFNMAVSDNNDKDVLFVSRLEGSHTLLDNPEHDQEKQEVQCITVDKIFEENNIDKIDFLKMDIEGAEIKVFDNMSDETLSKIRKVALEYHHQVFNFDDKLRKQLVERFLNLGFKIYTLHLRDDCLNMLYFWKS